MHLHQTQMPPSQRLPLLLMHYHSQKAQQRPQQPLPPEQHQTSSHPQHWQPALPLHLRLPHHLSVPQSLLPLLTQQPMQ